jgi:hypothetical protein
MFLEVLNAAGLAVKIGEGDTRAPHRLAGPAELHALLQAWLKESRSL